MKFFTLFVIFTLSSVVAFSQNQKISITHLSGNFYIHTSYKLLNEYPYPSNGLLAIADSGAILIDTPWD